IMLGAETFTWDEMQAVDCLVTTLRLDEGLIFTADSLIVELREWGAAMSCADQVWAADHFPALDAGVAKLERETPAARMAWLNGGKDGRWSGAGKLKLNSEEGGPIKPPIMLKMRNRGGAVMSQLCVASSWA